MNNSVSTYNARSTKSIALSVDPTLYEQEERRLKEGLTNADFTDPQKMASSKVT